MKDNVSLRSEQTRRDERKPLAHGKQISCRKRRIVDVLHPSSRIHKRQKVMHDRERDGILNAILSRDSTSQLREHNDLNRQHRSVLAAKIEFRPENRSCCCGSFRFLPIEKRDYPVGGGGDRAVFVLPLSRGQRDSLKRSKIDLSPCVSNWHRQAFVRSHQHQL